MSRRVLAACCAIALGATVASARPYSEDFRGPVRQSVWSVRNAGAPNRMSTSDGRLHVTVGVDQLVWPWNVPGTTAPMLLVAPPARDAQFTLETHMRVIRPGGGSWKSMAGLAMIRKDGSAAWIWGMLDAGRIALREHDPERIHEVAWVDIEATDDADEGTWLQIVKDDEQYSFRHKFHGDDEWVETTARPWGVPEFPESFGPGEYLVGLIVAGGGQEALVEFDYFDSPELGVLDVSVRGKLPVAWAGLRRR